jgi:hypothetical protein
MNVESVLYVLSELGIKADNPRGKNVQISCPLARYSKAHKGNIDSHPSMGISIDSEGESFVNCFTCKWGSTLQTFVDELFRVGFIDEAKALKVSSFLAGLEEAALDAMLNSIIPYDVRYEIADDDIFEEERLKPYARKTHKYAIDRGLSLTTIKCWEGGYDRKAQRVLFPVRNFHGRLVGAVGRTIYDEVKPPYMNYWEFTKGDFLFGEHKVIRDTTMIVVEGLWDAISVWQALARNNMLRDYSVAALLGSDATLRQIRKIISMSSDVLLFLDNDSAGWAGSRKLGKALFRETLVRCVEYPQNSSVKDPDSLIRTGVDICSLIEDAKLFR